MGYELIYGHCWACRRPFTFNADWVPSIPVEGVKQPVCEGCMLLANEKRIAAGLSPHPIDPRAYEAQEVPY